VIASFPAALESDLLAAFDLFLTRHGCQNRSEAARDPIRKNLVDEQWRSEQGAVVGVISLADRLIALRGVKHGGLTATATGQASK
jgi:CopG family nickel-responsive transcriptional regulator